MATPSPSAADLLMVMHTTGETDPRVLARMMERPIDDDLDELHALGAVADGPPLAPAQ